MEVAVDEQEVVVDLGQQLDAVVVAGLAGAAAVASPTRWHEAGWPEPCIGINVTGTIPVGTAEEVGHHCSRTLAAFRKLAAGNGVAYLFGSLYCCTDSSPSWANLLGGQTCAVQGVWVLDPDQEPAPSWAHWRAAASRRARGAFRVKN